MHGYICLLQHGIYSIEQHSSYCGKGMNDKGLLEKKKKVYKTPIEVSRSFLALDNLH